MIIYQKLKNLKIHKKSVSISNTLAKFNKNVLLDEWRGWKVIPGGKSGKLESSAQKRVSQSVGEKWCQWGIGKLHGAEKCRGGDLGMNIT